jgi:hypothetical protein
MGAESLWGTQIRCPADWRNAFVEIAESTQIRAGSHCKSIAAPVLGLSMNAGEGSFSARRAEPSTPSFASPTQAAYSSHPHAILKTTLGWAARADLRVRGDDKFAVSSQ